MDVALITLLVLVVGGICWLWGWYSGAEHDDGSATAAEQYAQGYRAGQVNAMLRCLDDLEGLVEEAKTTIAQLRGDIRE